MSSGGRTSLPVRSALAATTVRGVSARYTPLDCVSCAAAETVRPTKLFRTKATSEVGSGWTLADLQATVVQAEQEQFATWFAARTAYCGTPSRNPDRKRSVVLLRKSPWNGEISREEPRKIK
jgi:hypothetical protein